ncbi:MAG: phospholipase D family protein [Gammaproteobacteria bacterium]|nr:phospholipase D family protein [Gammaproteobacteria bacterium]MBU1441758.1 phospholipase D family protein [Gammaproteobacteria bacterium]MBU2410070.1 phospholipase D family protein [Gammaproteobacteria bacterium]
MSKARAGFSAWLLFVVVGWACLSAGCAGLPAQRSTDPPQLAIPLPEGSELGRIAAPFASPKSGLSAIRPLPQASFALDARIELLRRAQSSLDVQSYQLGNDKTGRLILRELRDAARRGVRVRLLLDDFYTTGLDPLLLALASEANAQVRLFNPFANGREHSATRWLDFFTDFRRLNHRMHNKLFIADGAIAIAGGRNLADEYFLRSDVANFIDFELLMAGPVVPESARIFDSYWNSDVVYPIESVARSSESVQALSSEFDAATSPAQAPRPEPPPARDIFGDPPLGVQLDSGRLPWMRAAANALADSPNKALGAHRATTPTLAMQAYAQMAQAKSQVLVVSPYFIPGEEGMARIRMGRKQGVRITVVTNSLADSDEPLVNINYNRYRVEMLRLGVELQEVSTRRLKRNVQLNRLLKQARGRLHAKLALIDREWVLLGSMNLDPRSERLNTEFGVRVHSAELAHAILYAYLLDDLEGVYRVELRPDNQTVQWVGQGDDAKDEVLDDEPDSSMLTRLQLLLFSWFVPSDQL